MMNKKSGVWINLEAFPPGRLPCATDFMFLEDSLILV